MSVLQNAVRLVWLVLPDSKNEGKHLQWPSSGSEVLVVVTSLRPDSSEASASDEVSHTITSLASKYSARDSATEGERATDGAFGRKEDI